jgi:hypothetical protein
MNKELAESFVRWYHHFPKKVSVGAAKKKWEQINPDSALVDKMIEAAKFQTEEYLKENGQQSGSKAFKYFQGPAPWLNAEAWENEIIKKKEYIKRDKRCHCGQPATNAGKLGVFFCADCWDGHDPERADLLKAHFISLNIRQKDGKWREPCMEYMRRLGGFGGLVGNG